MVEKLISNHCIQEKCNQALKIMKISILMFFLCFFNVVAENVYSQQKEISLDVKNVTIREAISQIERSSDYVFLIADKADAELNRKININAKKESINEVLKTLLKNTSLDYRVVERQVLLYGKESSPTSVKTEVEAAQPQQQQFAVFKGTVLDEKKEPLPGVSIIIDGTTIGTVSDVDGKFQLDLPAGVNMAVVFSFIGMETQYHIFQGKPETITLIMQQEEQLLEDIVVIGYGSKDKKSLTSSISSIDKNQLEKLSTATATLDNMLGGAIKGVRMNQTSGEPGATATINVRGITSPFPNLLSGQESNIPLYVINGVPTFVESSRLNPLLSISPNDIESIDVLKDASATAIYGSRGANGVIIVTTKTGKKEEAITVDFGYNFSVGNPVKEFSPLTTAEFKTYQDLVLRNTVNAMNTMDEYYMPKSYASDSELNALGDVEMEIDWDTYEMSYKYNGLREDAFGTANTNWARAIRNKNAQTHQYNLSLRGGSEKTDYNVSFNAMNQEGLEINDYFNHYGIRSGLNSDITSRIKIGTNISYSHSKRTGASEMVGYKETYSPWLIRPDFPVYDENGLFQRLDGKALNYGLDNMMANPVAFKQRESIFQSNQFMGNAYFEFLILKGLTFHSDVSMALSNGSSNYFTPLVSKDQNILIPFVSSLTTSNSESTKTSVNFRLDYRLREGAHDFSAMAGVGGDRDLTKSQSYSYEDFPNDKYLNNTGSARTMLSYSDYFSKNGLNSIYSRVTYGYNDRYLAELSLRADESSKFGPNNRWGVFPAVSLGWRIKQESFLIDNETIDDLKLRLSHGKTGSTNVPDFSYRQYFERNSGSLYGNEMAILLRDLLPNEDVRWEMTTENNLGIDFSLFNRRLYGSLDLYNRYTDGALAPAPHILESGISSYYANIIDMSNRGYELEIGGSPVRNADFSWDISFNISANRNKIEKLNSATLNPFMQDAFIEGMPAGTIKGYKVLGIIQTQEEIDKYNRQAVESGHPYYQESHTGIGDYLIQDTDGNNRITNNDRVVIANPEPKFFGGLINSLRYKQVELSFLMQFSQGAQAQWSPILMDLAAPIGLSVHREVFNNLWTPENTGARYPNPVYASMISMNSTYTDRTVFDASYFRMKNVTLTYQLPAVLYSKLGLKNASLFTTMTNLFTITSWPGIDPELMGTGTTLMGRNEDPYPLSKTFSIGAKLTF